MADYIEGKRPIIEALLSETPVKAVFLADNLRRDDAVAEIQRAAVKRGVPVRFMPRARLDTMSSSGAHFGAVAEVEPYHYVNIAQIEKRAEEFAALHEGRALIVVLDHITDAGNLGAIIRSAEAVGASGVVIPQKRAAGVTSVTYKTSAGAVAHLPVAQVANLTQALQRLKDEGFWCVAATEHADQVVWDCDLQGKIVIVMGSEGEGVSRLVRESCDFTVALPQLGKVSSLNVAQAATALFYEWLRQNTQSAQKVNAITEGAVS